MWWNCRGIIDKEYLKSELTINSVIYSNMLIEICGAVREKRRNESRRKVVLFHQDNARQHVTRDPDQTHEASDLNTLAECSGNIGIHHRSWKRVNIYTNTSLISSMLAAQ
ncbi:hypothetical protein AVEN_41741-1 [Araneus ventricosus]|uniref:Uncharacterized protein n=1 Tax=Araneus ventricosus TaxID=182803 RepID=A0A4Y2ABZ9_ARAVE|nr:hypothetical protein AVEN_41741-1 [Araneus ventricosus]